MGIYIVPDLDAVAAADLAKELLDRLKNSNGADFLHTDTMKGLIMALNHELTERTQND